ncbi:hypothetical protein FDH66_gp38 [Arthrobacter phage Amigo]|uniref:Uncharacterized protein n=5 Tax=Amigovirus amigo TaxID=1982100 RepID=A0A5J6TD88_9CAUD|nr:hypothetical protein FDH66_gp38 [Arthrobacter phage Amigo]QFG08358.1 hypothetical protein SEA_YEEZUS_66 [Arthrobacter phage Yeezus]QFG13407.1 hypothetical protein SEA_ICHOR_66 [Arthrobacter phage Ichor]QFG13925.1 hypothetical protein SEA_JAEK_66 [Arthrobacter phage Jaek]QJD51712.1 hypothetical protein SEA_BOERSMA_69 [Arthrobacter phage Boersma]ALY08415.1 hypothetical protein AMIGO_67 [Arthrobacter phage Amigo]
MTYAVGQFVTLTKEIGPWPVGTTAQIKPNPIKVQADNKSDFQYEHHDLAVKRTYLIAILTKNPNNHIDSFTVDEDEIKVAVLEKKNGNG